MPTPEAMLERGKFERAVGKPGCRGARIDGYFFLGRAAIRKQEKVTRPRGRNPWLKNTPQFLIKAVLFFGVWVCFKQVAQGFALMSELLLSVATKVTKNACPSTGPSGSLISIVLPWVGL